MNTLNFARVLRGLAVLGLILILDDLQRSTGDNINMIFATEIVLIAVVIFMTRIIEIIKSEQTNKPSGF